MFSMTTFPEIDLALRLIGIGAAILFVLYLIVFFARTFWHEGILVALVRLFSFQVIIPFLLTVALNLLVFSVVFIPPQQVGVVVSFPSPDGVRPQPLRGGFHMIIPFLERVRKYPIYWQNYTMSNKYNEGDVPGVDSIRARTSDGQEIRLACSLIYRIDSQQAVLVHVDWQDRYPQDLVRPLTRGIVRSEVSQFTVDEVNSSARRDLEIALNRILNEELAEKGFVLDQFLVRDIAFSPEYSEAIEEKQVALEAQIRAEYEAERMRRLARGRADAIIIEAQGRSEGLSLINESVDGNTDLLTYSYIERLTPYIRAMLVPTDAPLILPLQDLLSDTAPMSPTMPMTPTNGMDTTNGADASTLTNAVNAP